MQPVSLDCPNCGAALPPRDPAATITCEYCRTRFEPHQFRSGRTVAGQQLNPQELASLIVAAQEAMARSRGMNPGQGQVTTTTTYVTTMPPTPMDQGTVRSINAIVGIIVLMTVLGIGVTTFLILMPVIKDMPSGASVVGGASNEHLLWHDTSRPTQVVKHAGEPLVLAVLRRMPDDQLFLQASKSSGESLWRSPDLGQYMQAYQHTFVFGGPDFVALSDFRAELKFLGLADGKEMRSVKLTDKVKALCASEDAREVIAVQIDEKVVGVNADTGTVREATIPANCDMGQFSSSSDWEAVRARNEFMPEGLEVKAFAEDGDLGVALAHKTKGTKLPRLVGYDPASKAIRFDVEAYSIDSSLVRDGSWEHVAIADGKVFTHYGSGQEGWQLVALDAKTGQRLWEITLRPLFAVDWVRNLEVADGLLLVQRTSSMELYDPSNGKLLGTLGRETYD